MTSPKFVQARVRCAKELFITRAFDPSPTPPLAVGFFSRSDAPSAGWRVCRSLAPTALAPVSVAGVPPPETSTAPPLRRACQSSVVPSAVHPIARIPQPAPNCPARHRSCPPPPRTNSPARSAHIPGAPSTPPAPGAEPARSPPPSTPLAPSRIPLHSTVRFVSSPSTPFFATNIQHPLYPIRSPHLYPLYFGKVLTACDNVEKTAFRPPLSNHASGEQATLDQHVQRRQQGNLAFQDRHSLQPF